MSRHTVESMEVRIELHGRTISGTLASDDEGGLSDLIDTLLETGEVERIEVRDSDSHYVWSVIEPDDSHNDNDNDNEGTTE